MDLVKMLAGTYSANVNARTNGGYTPCHIAMQFGHEEVYKILVESYSADPNLRDWSGRKPRQYLTNQDTSLSADTYRSEYRPRDRPSAAVKLLTFGSSLPRSKRRRCAKKDAATADDLGGQQHGRRRRHVLPSLSFSPKHSAADSPFSKGDKPRNAGGGDNGSGGGGSTDTYCLDALYFSALS